MYLLAQHIKEVAAAHSVRPPSLPPLPPPLLIHSCNIRQRLQEIKEIADKRRALDEHHGVITLSVATPYVTRVGAELAYDYKDRYCQQPTSYLLLAHAKAQFLWCSMHVCTLDHSAVTLSSRLCTAHLALQMHTHTADHSITCEHSSQCHTRTLASLLSGITGMQHQHSKP